MLFPCKTFFIFGTQIKIFDEIQELSDPLIYSKGTTTIKAQKRIKHIINLTSLTVIL